MRRLLVLALLLCALPVGAQVSYYSSGSAAAYLVKAAPNVATSGTSHEALYTITVPANTLSSVGDALVVTAHFTTAADTNTKYGRLTSATVGGTIVAATTTSVSAQHVSLQVFIMRTSASTAVCLQPVYYSATVPAGTNVKLTGLDFTAPLTFIVTGLTPSAAGGITLEAVAAYVSK